VTRYLADTSAWNRSRLIANRWAKLLEANEIGLCAPVRLELLYSARGRSDYRAFASDLAWFPDFSLDGNAASRAETTQAELAERSGHRGPTPVDLLIAAIAELHELVLLHYDRHFEQIGRVTGQPTEWLARPGSLT
jgi:predicted nucleic acid-binding protein